MAQEINANNMDTEILSQMWSNYSRNVLFNLEDTTSLHKPL
jgi:DASH complex subunit DAD4